MPGAGLEPARTLPGPRDFKSENDFAKQHSSRSKARKASDLWFGVCLCSLVDFGGLGTATGTVWAQHQGGGSGRLFPHT
jgi:hypothetical protein